jgi:hypothetical protein
MINSNKQWHVQILIHSEWPCILKACSVTKCVCVNVFVSRIRRQNPSSIHFSNLPRYSIQISQVFLEENVLYLLFFIEFTTNNKRIKLISRLLILMLDWSYTKINYNQAKQNECISHKKNADPKQMENNYHLLIWKLDAKPKVCS